MNGAGLHSCGYLDYPRPRTSSFAAGTHRQKLAATNLPTRGVSPHTRMRTARSKFLVHYPDGSRMKIGPEQKQQMLRDGLLFNIDGHQFRYTGQAFRFHRLADLRVFHRVITAEGKRLQNYPGLFIREHKSRRRKEWLEPPEKMAIRLRAEGVIA